MLVPQFYDTSLFPVSLHVFHCYPYHDLRSFRVMHAGYGSLTGSDVHSYALHYAVEISVNDGFIDIDVVCQRCIVLIMNMNYHLHYVTRKSSIDSHWKSLCNLLMSVNLKHISSLYGFSGSNEPHIYRWSLIQLGGGLQRRACIAKEHFSNSYLGGLMSKCSPFPTLAVAILCCAPRMAEHL